MAGFRAPNPSLNADVPHAGCARQRAAGFVRPRWRRVFIWDPTRKLAENHWSQRLYGHILGCIERLAWHLTSLRDEASRASRRVAPGAT